MNKVCILITALLTLLSGAMGVQAGNWQFFPYADTYRRVQCAGDQLYILMGNRLMLADAPAWECKYEFTRLNGLSDHTISDIAYSQQTGKLAIIYTSGVVDILHADGSYTSIPDLKATPFAGHSKQINSAYEQEGLLHLSTSFGFLTIDLSQEVILHCITTSAPVTSTWVSSGKYYYRNTNGQIFGCPTSANLYNPANWIETNTVTPPSTTLPDGAVDQCLSCTGDTIYTLYPGTGLSSNHHTSSLQLSQYQMGGNNNRLHLTGGQLAACHASDLTFQPYEVNIKAQGYLTEYDTLAHQWNNYSDQHILAQLTQRKTFGGVMDMLPDPAIPHRYYYSTLENGIYVVQDGMLEGRWDNFYTPGMVDAFVDNSTRVGGMAFSPTGDLWYINEGMSDILRVHTHNDKWYKYSLPDIDGQFNMPHLIHTRAEGSHTLWGCKNAGYQKCYVFAYDYGGTLISKADDRHVSFMKLIDQNGHIIHPYYFYNIAEAPDGSIWILTTSGIYVIDHPDDVFEHPGQVRTVFDGMVANDIAFDTEQRIWIATAGQGIYLYDATGRTLLQHFTTDNSMLASDEILALAFDGTTNTLWTSCLGAILSYQYSPSEYASVSQHTMFCYPDVMSSEDIVPVNIVGLQDHSLISISNDQGLEVYTTHAIAGVVSITPDFLPAGTYIIHGTDADGEYGEQCRFTIE